jgi:hypothetical protein
MDTGQLEQRPWSEHDRTGSKISEVISGGWFCVLELQTSVSGRNLDCCTMVVEAQIKRNQKPEADK